MKKIAMTLRASAFLAALPLALTISFESPHAQHLPNSSNPAPSSITQIAPVPSILSSAPLSLVVYEMEPGTNVRVNTNPLNLTRPQTEPSISSNPNNSGQLVAGYIDYLNGPLAFDSSPGVSLSKDGGKTWVTPATGQTLPDPPGFQWGSRTLSTHLAGGDPAVAWGLGDTVYYSAIGFHDNSNPPNNDCSSGGLYVYRSDDGGNTWLLPALGPAIPNTQTTLRDKEYIAVDSNSLSPFAGRVYMVWDDDLYSDCPQNFAVNFVTRRISFSLSADNGATWSTPIVLATGCLVAPVPAVSPNGDLHVVWFDCNSGTRQMVRRSTDGGMSFAPEIAAASGLASVPTDFKLAGSNFGFWPGFLLSLLIPLIRAKYM